MDEKLDFIKENRHKAYKTQVDFFNAFIDEQEKQEYINKDERSKRIGRYKKALQRGSPADTIDGMYEFLLKNKKIKKADAYKPLTDSKFEREILGESHYREIIKNQK